MRRTPSRPIEREAAEAAVRYRPLVPRDDAAQLEHREEVGSQPYLERQPERAAVVAPYADGLAERATGLGAPLDPEPQALRRQPLPVLQLQVRVRQLVDGDRPLGVRRGEEPRQLPADAHLEGA